MAFIFENEPGVACVLVDPAVVPITLRIQNWWGYAYTRCILQGITISSTANVQFLSTLRNYTYVYVFGEKMGDLIIQGLTFMSDCYGSTSGISGVIGYYARNALSSTGSHLAVQIGLAGFYAFLVGCTVLMLNEETRIGQFTLTFKTVPT